MGGAGPVVLLDARERVNAQQLQPVHRLATGR